MLILSNCHTHTTFCDGKSPAEETVLEALRRGFLSLGFTSHAPQHFDLPYAVAPDRERDYIREIRALAEKYRDRIRILCGIERDLFSCADPAPYDYYIASVHYLPMGDRMIAVDGAPEGLEEMTRTCFGGRGLSTCGYYYSLLAAYAAAMRPPVVGHFDLIRKNNAALGLFDEDDPAYLDLAASALRAVRAAGSLLEVNTGGMARGYMTEPYPSPAILRIWRGMGGEVTVSSDCHRAGDLAYAFDMLPGLLSSLGYERIFVLGTGDRLFEPVPLSASTAPARTPDPE